MSHEGAEFSFAFALGRATGGEKDACRQGVEVPVRRVRVGGAVEAKPDHTRHGWMHQDGGVGIHGVESKQQPDYGRFLGAGYR